MLFASLFWHCYITECDVSVRGGSSSQLALPWFISRHTHWSACGHSPFVIMPIDIPGTLPDEKSKHKDSSCHWCRELVDTPSRNPISPACVCGFRVWGSRVLGSFGVRGKSDFCRLPSPPCSFPKESHPTMRQILPMGGRFPYETPQLIDCLRLACRGPVEGCNWRERKITTWQILRESEKHKGYSMAEGCNRLNRHTCYEGFGAATSLLHLWGQDRFWWQVNTRQVEVMLAVGYHDNIVVCTGSWLWRCLCTCHPCVRETILSLDFSQHCGFMTVLRYWLCRCLLVCLPSRCKTSYTVCAERRRKRSNERNAKLRGIWNPTEARMGLANRRRNVALRENEDIPL